MKKIQFHDCLAQLSCPMSHGYMKFCLVKMEKEPMEPCCLAFAWFGISVTGACLVLLARQATAEWHRLKQRPCPFDALALLWVTISEPSLEATSYFLSILRRSFDPYQCYKLVTFIFRIKKKGRDFHLAVRIFPMSCFVCSLRELIYPFSLLLSHKH